MMKLYSYLHDSVSSASRRLTVALLCGLFLSLATTDSVQADLPQAVLVYGHKDINWDWVNLNGLYVYQGINVTNGMPWYKSLHWGVPELYPELMLTRISDTNSDFYGHWFISGFLGIDWFSVQGAYSPDPTDGQWYAYNLYGVPPPGEIGDGVPNPIPFPIELINRINADMIAATKEPIDTLSGSMFHGETDVVIPCPGPDLVFRRSYNSGLDYTNSPVGARWIHCYDWSLIETNMVYDGDDFDSTNTCLYVTTGNGRTFGLVGYETNTLFRAERDVAWHGAKATNGTYAIVASGGTQYAFDTNGVLQSVADLWGNTVTLTYTNDYPTNLLIKVEHGNGQYLSMSYTDGLLTGLATPSNTFSMSYGYNSNREITSTTRSIAGDSFTTTYLYDSATNWANHSLTQLVNAAGDVFSYGYATNASGYSTSVCTNMVLGTNYYAHGVEYHTNDGYSVVTYARDGSNIVVQNHYDSDFMRVTNVYGPGGTNIVTTYNYDPVLLNITNTVVRDTSLNEWVEVSRAYDGCKNVTAESFGYCAEPTNTWLCSWDTNWQQLASVEDPEGVKTAFEYTNGSICRISRYFNETSTYDTAIAYTANGLPSAITNANGHWARAYYDGYGNPTCVVPQAGIKVGYEWDVLGHLTKTLLYPQVLESDYPPSTNTATTVRTIEYGRNELGWVSNTTYPDGLTESLLYDDLGNPTSHVDRAGRTTTLSWHPTRKLASVTRVLNGTNVTTSIDYGQQSDMQTISDALGRTVEAYELDLQNRPVKVTNVETQEMTVSFGVGSFINAVTRFDATTVSNAYGVSGLPIATHFPDATNHFTYRSNGALCTASNSAGLISNSWNTLGWLSGTDGTAPSSAVSYAYYPAGQVSNMASVAGTSTYLCDAAERLTNMVSQDGTFQWTYSTNNGLVATLWCTNGVTASYVFDIVDRLTGIIWRDSSSNIIRSVSYEHSAADLITVAEYDTGESVLYSYDGIDRLVGETRFDALDSIISEDGYSYDLVGNRLQKTHEDIEVDYSYGAGNRLSQWTVPATDLVASVDVVGHANETIGADIRYGKLYISNATALTPWVDGTNFWVYSMPVSLGTQDIVAVIRDEAGNTAYATNSVYLTAVTNVSFGYSTAGCVTSMVWSGVDYSKTIVLDWDTQYELTSVSSNSTTLESYTYDSLGRRVSITSDGATTYLVYDGPHVVAEVDGAGGLERSYSYGPGIDNILAMTVYGTITNTYYFLADHLGSVLAATDESGAIVESYRYDAWGRVLGAYDAGGEPLAESAIGNRFLWQGREWV